MSMQDEEIRSAVPLKKETVRITLRNRPDLSVLHYASAIDPVAQRFAQLRSGLLLLEEIGSRRRLAQVRWRHGPIRAMECVSGGAGVLVVDQDWGLRYWDVAGTKRLRKVQAGGNRELSAISSCPYGPMALTGDKSGTITVSNLAKGRRLDRVERIETGEGSISVLAISVDGGHAACGYSNGAISVWNLKSGKRQFSLKAHEGNVSALRFSADARKLLSGSHDNSIRIWDVESGVRLAILLGHSAQIDAVDWSADGRMIASVSRGPEVSTRIWNVEDGEVPQRPVQHDGWISFVQWERQLGQVFTGGKDGSLRVWNASSGECCAQLNGQREWLRSICVLGGKDSITIAGGDCGCIYGWKGIASEAPFCIVKAHNGTISYLTAVGSDGQFITGGGDGLLRMWSCDLVTAEPMLNQTPECVATLKGHSLSITSASLSGNGLRLLSASKDHTLRLWDLRAQRCKSVFEGHRNEVSTVLFLDQDKKALSGSTDGEIIYWDVRKRALLSRWHGHESDVTVIHPMSNQGQVLTASDDGTLRLWDLERSRSCVILRGHTDSVRSISVSHDGKLAVSGSWDQTVRLWDLVRGTILAVYHADAAIARLAVNWAHPRCVCGDASGQVHFIDINLPN